jgi:transcriptional regulator with XRE-family HTH domain
VARRKMPIHPLRNWLLEQQRTQEDLAAEVGVKQGYLSLIITGRRRPSKDLARKISRATRRAVTMDQLLSFEIPAGVDRKPRGGKTRQGAEAAQEPIVLPEQPDKLH